MAFGFIRRKRPQDNKNAKKITRRSQMNYTKILVVDDDSNIRDLLKQSLENEGYEVRTAADGYEAIDGANNASPSIREGVGCGLA